MTIDGVEVGTISLLGRMCSKVGQIAGVKFASNPNQKHVPNSTQITPTRGHQFQVISANQFSGQNNNGQKSVEQLVSDFLLLPQNMEMTEGTPRDVIREHLGIPLDRLKLAIENLTYEGQIYEGVTDRYKSAIDG
ncbi:unnamed protein product [Vicia faba]|uniref:Replication protein A C-terminal domain-containing protein n=1 Tax=Vicia faba TaxID=3906 RepID=A0AAV0ZAI5_VICFA|nr:unnamed protein product [Vicia faba]